MKGRARELTAAFLDSSHAWIWPRGFGNPRAVTIFATTDGGRSWNKSSFAAALAGPGEIHFVDPLHGWIVGNVAAGPRTGCVGGVGACYGTDPVEVWRTVDGGKSWTSLSVSSHPNIRNLPAATAQALPPCYVNTSFRDRLTGYAVSSCPTNSQFATSTQFYVTHDAGQTWFPFSISPPVPSDGGAAAPIFTSPTDAYMTTGGPGHNPTGPGIYVGFYVTHDAGRTWTLLDLSHFSFAGGLTFSDSLHGWFYGGPSEQTVFVTSDGGLHWSRFKTNRSLLGASFQFVDPMHGWALSMLQHHCRPTPGQAPPPSLELREGYRKAIRVVHPRPQQCSPYPSLLRTDDGGHTWTELRLMLNG